MITKQCGNGVTHQQIADQMGISRQLVTHALNGTRHSRISEETRLEIQKVARKLNYQPRNLTTHNIGYILPVHGNGYLESEHILSVWVERAAKAAGYRLVVLGIEDRRELSSLAQTFNVKTVDGVISPRWYGGEIRTALPANLPLLLTTDEYDVSPEIDVVCTDSYATARTMAEYLKNCGHARIGLAVGGGQVKQHYDIIHGVQDALGDFSLIKGSTGEVVAMLDDYLQNPGAPTAWLASSAAHAMAIMYGLYERGMKVPGDVSVVSLMDSPAFEAMPVALTATDTMGRQIAEMAVEVLAKRLMQSDLPPVYQYLPAQIIERDSVAKVASVAVR